MTWLPFTNSNLDDAVYRCWRENVSWAIRVRYNWKFDIVLRSLRRIQYICMNTDAIENHICMTWLPFSYSNLDVTMYRGWRKNDSWAIRVKYNWKFDIVLQSLRRIQYICMNNDAIETIFAWRDYHFLIQIWTWPCIDVDGKMIRGRFGWGIIESLTLFFKACVVYNISAWIPMRSRPYLHDVTTIF